MSSSQQGFLRKFRIPPWLFRLALNLWPPFLGAGIRVLQVSLDYRAIDVRLRLGLLNRNYVGTHFGGSLFAMTDPFFMLMLVHNLGPDYVIWDKSATIDYVKPGRGDVLAHFHLDEASIAQVVAATAGGDKHEPTFAVDVVDHDGNTIAHVEKTLYVRRKLRAAGAAQPTPGTVA